MPLFQYQGRNTSGQVVTGQFEAETEEAVANYLFGLSVTPVEINAYTESSSIVENIKKYFAKRNVSLVELIFFSRQMHTLLRSGVPIMQALQGLRESTPSDVLADVIGALREGLDAGEDLTTAMRHHPDVFPGLYISIVEIGETSGSLPESFQKLVVYLELERETRERIKSAMRYPTIVMGAIVIAMFVINLFVIPAFSKVFASFNAELPLPTRILMATSNFTVNYWYVVVGGMIALLIWLRIYIASEKGRLKWDQFKLKIPVVGDIIYKATVGRFALALSICIKSGVSWGQSMLVVSNAVDNKYIGAHIITMRDEVERGTTITHAASGSGLFPATVLQMISVGEETGALDSLMSEVAEYYEGEVEYQLKNLSTAIEPFLLLCVGIMVLILALGVFLPMWDLSTAAFGK
jgi:MSHA biogenesis protein MshG